MSRQPSHHDLESRPGKGVRLGKFEPAPMHSTTLDLHGLSARDAVEVLERKIQRALLAGTERVKVLYGSSASKVEKALNDFLSHCKAVKSYHADESRPGVTWVLFIDEQKPAAPPQGLARFLR